jgi:hypothetical protein
VLTDKQLSALFADGTSPEHDPAFVLSVAAEIGRTRLRMRFLALALRAAAMLMLSVAIVMASRLIEPVLARLVDGVLQSMGVPVPMVVLAVLVAGLVLLRGRLHAAA